MRTSEVQNREVQSHDVQNRDVQNRDVQNRDAQNRDVRVLKQAISILGNGKENREPKGNMEKNIWLNFQLTIVKIKLVELQALN